MSCLKDLKLSVIRKLKEAYYVKNPIQINNNQNTVKIIHFEKDELQRYIKHYFLLTDEERLFTTLDEAIDYCNQFDYAYDVVECKKLLINLFE